MPVIIRELHVKVNVDEKKNDRTNRSVPQHRETDSAALIEACVEKVVEILKMEERR